MKTKMKINLPDEEGSLRYVRRAEAEVTRTAQRVEEPR